jgi:hypothetical protein
MERMTAKDPTDGEKTPFAHPVSLDRLPRVLGAARVKATPSTQQGGEEVSV